VALVFGAASWRVAGASCSATTLRRRQDEWIAAGVMAQLEELAARRAAAGLGPVTVSLPRRPRRPPRPGCRSRPTGAMPAPPPPGRGALARRRPRTWPPPTAPAVWWGPPTLGSGPDAGGGASPPSPPAGWWGRSPPRPPRWPGWGRPRPGAGGHPADRVLPALPLRGPGPHDARRPGPPLPCLRAHRRPGRGRGRGARLRHRHRSRRPGDRPGRRRGGQAGPGRPPGLHAVLSESRAGRVGAGQRRPAPGCSANGRVRPADHPG